MDYGLNEVVVEKKEIYSLNFDIFVDEAKLMSVNSDGLLVCTSNGSSAYNSSLRGPLMTPSSKNLILNFFAPFGKNCLPLVLNENQTIKIKLSSNNWQSEGRIVIDSHTIVTVTKEHSIILKFDNKNNYIDLICPYKTNLITSWISKVNNLMKWD